MKQEWIMDTPIWRSLSRKRQEKPHKRYIARHYRVKDRLIQSQAIDSIDCRVSRPTIWNISAMQRTSDVLPSLGLGLAERWTRQRPALAGSNCHDEARRNRLHRPLVQDLLTSTQCSPISTCRQSPSVTDVAYNFRLNVSGNRYAK